MAGSARGDERHRRQHDHVDSKHEQGRMPDMLQQPKRSATRRNAIVTSQAATISNDIGAT
jgi:hypothetical protein